jgi:hypothetical protein
MPKAQFTTAHDHLLKNPRTKVRKTILTILLMIILQTIEYYFSNK